MLNSQKLLLELLVAFLELGQTFKMELFVKIVKTVNYFHEKLDLKCLNGF